MLAAPVALLSSACLTTTAIAAATPDSARTYLTLDHRNIIDRQHELRAGPRVRRQAHSQPDPKGGEGMGAPLRQLPALGLGRSS
jgi:hypothetical protein